MDLDAFIARNRRAGTYRLGMKSLANLSGVDPYLDDLVRGAIRITGTDFTVFEGVRSEERQRMLYDIGKSRTLRSRHLTGHAVDLVPWIHGRARWDWSGCYDIAAAIAVTELALGERRIRWGGVWDTRLADLLELTELPAPAQLRRAYLAYHERVGDALSDGVHFEIARGA